MTLQQVQSALKKGTVIFNNIGGKFFAKSPLFLETLCMFVHRAWSHLTSNGDFFLFANLHNST